VPRARRRRNEDVFSRNIVCDRVEKKKADRPKPDKTIPVAVPLCAADYIHTMGGNGHYYLRLYRESSSQWH
jgi:hypothetical protein